jgi:serine/threonine protein kinase
MNFNIIKKISSGSFGIVYLIKYNNDYAALKRINLNDLHYDDYRRQLHELNILFYIPCLLTNAYQSLLNEYNLADKTVISLIIIELLIMDYLMLLKK